MANTTIADLVTISGVNIATDDRFIVRDTSANTDLAITAAELRNMIVNTPIVLPTVISVNSASDALRITQTGSGDAIVVEDSGNPDSTPFVVKTDGRVGFGTTTPVDSVTISSLTTGDRIGLNANGAVSTLFLGSRTAGEGLSSVIYNRSTGDFTINNGNTASQIERLRITDTGVFVSNNFGVGTTTASNRLHTIETVSTANATIFPMRVEAQTSGTPAIGIGTGIALATETATANNVEIGATIESIATGVTGGAENFDLVFRTMSSGATAAERMRISSAGVLTVTGVGTFGGNVAVNGGTLSTSQTTFNAVNTTATTVNAFGAATTLALGYNSTLASTTNISAGSTDSGQTKTINVGTGGVAGSTTNVNVGSSGGGTTTIGSPIVSIANIADTSTAATHYYVEVASDGIIRPKTLANVRTEIVTTAAVNAAAATTVGTITSGTWNAGVIAGQYGGTGVNNTGRTITLGGNITTANSVTTSGNFAVTLTTTAETNVTLPTTGTLATLNGTEAFTNKTLDGLRVDPPATFTPTAAAPGSLSISATNTFVTVTPNATGTYTTTVPAAGTICYLMVVTSGVTSYTLTFGAGFRPQGTLATGTITARYFTIIYVSDGTNLVEMSRSIAV
jgi:hypothetical protein